MKTNDIHITLPASKSLSIRWLFVNYLTCDDIPLSGLSQSDDVRVLKHILATLAHNPADDLETPNPINFDCADSGAVARFLIAIMATRPSYCVISGSARLSQRPMAPLVDALRSLGACSIDYLDAEGYLPLRIKGGHPIKKLVLVNPSVSSQFVSALLLAGAASLRGLHIRMTKSPASAPYIEMTCKVLSQAGADNDYAPNHNTIRISPFSPKRFLHPVVIERDWSAAAFFYMAAVFLPHRRIRLVNLSLQSLQGDKLVAQLFNSFGVTTRQARSPYSNGNSVLIEGGGVVTSNFYFDFKDNPDLVLPMAVVSAAMGVDAWLDGLANLRYKESNRVLAIVEELRKMGADVQADKSSLHIKPAPLRPSAVVSSHADHRVAMAFGTLQLLFPDLVIDNPSVVNKSFPEFWTQLSRLRP